MDDGGLLMNFSVGDEPLRVKPIIKGGTWRDRRDAKRALERPDRGLRNFRVTPGTGVNTEELAERPAKKPKIHENQPTQNGRSNLNRPKEVISSLFSYNPAPKTEAKKEVQVEAKPAEPSNAPLPEGASNFTSLGLNSALATQLLTRLELKAPTAIQRTAMSKLLEENSDAFIQAETGSGKTLAYLLPIVQRLMEMSNELKDNDGQEKLLHRDSGLFAIILAPTRELCKQISVVLNDLLGCARWIVSGTVFGGEKKHTEKARLRKGLNILVATPGRLVDHLEHTSVLDVSTVRWLVLDEGDRLMELGFEEDIKAIIERLEDRSKVSQSNIPGLPYRRTTILCSATMKMTVQALGEISLKDAIHIKAETSPSTMNSTSKSTLPATAASTAAASRTESSKFSAPAQLQQSYILCPPKQRLVTLQATLKHAFARKGSVSKALVFLSCADSVDFHYAALSRPTSKSASSSSSDLPTLSPAPSISTSPSPPVSLYKLHGSLTQPLRTSTLSHFSRTASPSILLCTDVASRGLDLPSVNLVIEYDPPFSRDEHLHRVGRTARAGRDGRACIFLMPGPEEGYVDILRSSFAEGKGRVKREESEGVLKRTFGNKDAGETAEKEEKGNMKEKTIIKGLGEGRKEGGGKQWEDRATEWQLELERWVLGERKITEMARKAYISHVRAYATHVVGERGMFDVKELLLGHLCKAFGLREMPGNFGRGGGGGRGEREWVESCGASDLLSLGVGAEAGGA